MKPKRIVMQRELTAKATITISAPVERVWDALVNPSIIKQYMFGTEVASDWEEGSPIVWKGEWQGKKYEDKGTILKLKQQRMISYSPSARYQDCLMFRRITTLSS